MQKKLRCIKCGYTLEIGRIFSECPACLEKGVNNPLEVVYDYSGVTEEEQNSFGKCNSFWDYKFLLPVSDPLNIVTLGEGATPLVKSKKIGDGIGLKQVYFKNEFMNPTLAHKDRFQSVSISMAKELGFRGIVTVSTGNHGASATAYASAGGLESKVFCPPETSDTIKELIKIYGGEVVIAGWEERIHLMNDYIKDGWFPSTLLYSELKGTANPFGLEGYKTIAYELVGQLGKSPDHVFVPCARGDSLYGIWKGFNELLAMGIINTIPKFYGCQPQGANPLEISYNENLDYVVTIEKPYSIATSTREPSTGYHALKAIRNSKGRPISVTDDKIKKAVLDLGKEGLCVEAASALPVACLAELAKHGQISENESCVCILTSSGVKWPADLSNYINE